MDGNILAPCIQGIHYVVGRRNFVRAFICFLSQAKGIARAWCRSVKSLEGKISTKYPMKNDVLFASCLTGSASRIGHLLAQASHRQLLHGVHMRLLR
jgi:hypothetical protein